MHRVLGSCVASLLLMSLAVPTAAASSRWVDDDGRAGPSGCTGPDRAFRTIQPAVDASDEGDRVKVCPGTYRGHVRITTPGLRLVSVRPSQAVLRPRPGNDGGVSVASAGGALVSGFAIVIPSTRHGGICDYPGGGIDIRSANDVRIEDNLITNEGSHTRSCGGGGIELSGASRAVILRNTLRDGWGIGGSSSAEVTVNANRILFRHDGDRSHDRIDVVGGIGLFSVFGATVVTSNTVEGPPGATRVGDLPEYGIRVAGGGPVLIRDNRIRRVADGIRVQGASYDTAVTGNDVRYGSGIGIRVEVWDLRVEGNVVRGFAGPGVSSTVGNGVIADNDFRHNDADGVIDCVQAPITPGGGVHPTEWRDNLGDGSDPEGICTPTG